MKSNPGGRIDPKELLGRDEIITKLWGILKHQSVYMNDLRRIGKTQVMVKMEAEAPDEWLVIKRDVEGHGTADEFAAYVYQDALRHVSGGAKAMAGMKKLLGSVSGVEIAGVIKLGDQSTPSWKEVIARTFADLDAQMKVQDKLAVFMWDEVPFLLSNIAKRSPETAMALLDVLRSMTQEHKNIRLLLTGSIGLHHTLRHLEEQGYLGSPLNHMELVQLGPLTSYHAIDLATRLLAGDMVPVGDRASALATWIADAAGNVPYYIHKIVRHMPREKELREDALEVFLNQKLDSPDNDWDLDHYENHISRYFGKRAPIAFAAMDSLAVTSSLSFEELDAQVRSQTDTDTEGVRETLKLLRKDHYVTKAGGRYAFYLQIVQRWWQLSRDLSGKR